MNRNELIKEVKKYFKIEELVCKHVFTKYREEQMWMFFSTQVLETLLVLRRDIINRPFVINNWKNGDNMRVLQIKFKDEEKLNKFLEVIETNRIELIDPKQLEKDGRKERSSKNYR